MALYKQTADSVEISEEGYLHMSLSGELDISTLKPILSQTDELIGKMKKKKVPIRMHVDATKLEVIKLDSRKHGAQWLRKNQCSRISVHGSNTFIKYFVNMLVRVAGNDMRYFTSEKEAKEWLTKTDS